MKGRLPTRNRFVVQEQQRSASNCGSQLTFCRRCLAQVKSLSFFIGAGDCKGEPAGRYTLPLFTPDLHRGLRSSMPLPFRHLIKRLARTVAVAVLAGVLCGCGASSSLDALDGGPGASANGGNGKLPGHVYLMWGLV